MLQSSHNAMFFTTMKKKLFVFDRETYLNFFVFLTSKCYYTGVNGENDMLVRYINSCGSSRLTSLCILFFQMATPSKVLNMGPKRFYEDFMKNIPGLMTSCRGFKKTDIAENH